MRKKILLLIFVLSSGANLIMAQCTPGPQTVSGIYPEAGVGIANAYVATPYSQVFTVVTPADTLVMGMTIDIDSVVIIGSSGLPSSIHIDCEPHAKCTFLGGSKRCVVLTGTPVASDTGDHPFLIFVNYYTSISPLAAKDTVTGYVLHVLAAQGVQENSALSFSLKPNVPNPASRYTEIGFTSTENENVTLKITDLLGRTRYTEVLPAKQGENSISYDASNLSDGIYFYSIGNKKQTLTRKMTIYK